MSAANDPFAALPLEEAIAARATACGIALSMQGLEAVARHARAVIAANNRLHLTSITEPREFLERHIGEAFEGATLLPKDVHGTLLDIGSGNGYPALPLVAARPGLRPLLVEASAKKAEFLEGVLHAWSVSAGEVRLGHVQRAADLEGVGTVRVITTRGVGGWARLLPKLAPLLDPEGVILLWAGQEVEAVRHRVVWRRYRLEGTRELPGRERSAVWLFKAA